MFDSYSYKMHDEEFVIIIACLVIELCHYVELGSFALFMCGLGIGVFMASFAIAIMISESQLLMSPHSIITLLNYARECHSLMYNAILLVVRPQILWYKDHIHEIQDLQENQET